MKYNSLAATMMICVSLSTLISAQTLPSQPSPPTKKQAVNAPANSATTPAATAIPSEPSLLAETRRIIAVSLLTSLANEAHDSQNLLLRAYIQARVAEALWSTDAEQARQLFRRAWDAAEAADQEVARKAEEASRKSTDSNPGLGTYVNSRNDVLRLAGVSDSKLADEFINKLGEAVERETGNTNPASSGGAGLSALSTAEARRLDIARQLAQNGDVQRASQFAAPVLNKVTEQTVHFLASLRLKDADAADSQYAALLRRSASDAASDANTVSLLSSYVFTPNFFVTVAANSDATSNQLGSLAPPAQFPSELRAMFFQTAAQILLRPLPPPDQDTTSSGRIGLYFTITRLLPLFERYAPNYVQDLRTQLIPLTTPASLERFDPNKSKLLNYGLNAKDTTAEESLETIDPSRITDSSERDSLYANAAHLAATKGDERARDLVERIGDTEQRKQVRSYIDVVLVTHAISQKDAEKVLRLISNGDLTRFQRAWALTEAARLVRQTDRPHALQLLDDAASEARRIADTDPERIRALLAVATQFHDLDLVRTWQVVEELVKSANKAERYTGGDGVINVRFSVKDNTTVKTVSTPTSSLSGIFSLLAKDDFNRAVFTAQNLNAQGPRAIGLISVARTALGERAKGSASKHSAGKK